MSEYREAGDGSTAHAAATYEEDRTKDEDEKSKQEDLEDHEVQRAQYTERQPPEMRGSKPAIVHGGILEDMCGQEPSQRQEGSAEGEPSHMSRGS